MCRRLGIERADGLVVARGRWLPELAARESSSSKSRGGGKRARNRPPLSGASAEGEAPNWRSLISVGLGESESGMTITRIQPFLPFFFKSIVASQEMIEFSTAIMLSRVLRFSGV